MLRVRKRYARLKIFQAKLPKSSMTPIYDIYLERRLTMANYISVDEHNEFHQLIELLRRAHDRGLLHSLFVDQRTYKITALSNYGKWSVSLTPPTCEAEE
jgi:hypothetical protein